MSPENNPELDRLIIVGKIKKAGEYVAAGDFYSAAKILPCVNTFEVMRLRLLIENNVKDEEELSYKRETPLLGEDTFQNLLNVCNDVQKDYFLRLDQACTLNEEVREQLERGYDLVSYGYYEEAASFVLDLTESYPSRAELWNLIILARSKVNPARSFDTPIYKKNSSLEKFTEVKEMLACADYKYMVQKPEYAERYLMTKADISKVKAEQKALEKTHLSGIFSKVVTCLGIASLAFLFPFFLFFEQVVGIVIGVVGMMLAVAAIVCNVRVNMLDRQKGIRESTLSYVLLLLLILIYIVTLFIGIPMAI